MSTVSTDTGSCKHLSPRIPQKLSQLHAGDNKEKVQQTTGFIYIINTSRDLSWSVSSEHLQMLLKSRAWLKNSELNVSSKQPLFCFWKQLLENWVQSYINLVYNLTNIGKNKNLLEENAKKKSVFTTAPWAVRTHIELSSHGTQHLLFHSEKCEQCLTHMNTHFRTRVHTKTCF